jgi:hypothetical protein
MKVFGTSYETARALSVVFAICLGVLIFRHAKARFGEWTGVVALILYVSSNLVFGWYAVTKTYALSTLLLFAAYSLVDRSSSKPGTRHWLAAGILLALAVDVRLIFAAAAPVFLVAALRSEAGRSAWPTVRSYLAGIAIGLAPNLFFIAQGPSEYVLGNIGWAQYRSDGGLVGDLGQKGETLGDLAGNDPQYVLLAALALAATVLLLAYGRRPPLAFWLALALIVASVLPTPTYTQYFCTSVPFLIFAALEAVRLVELRRAVRVAVVVAAAGFAALGIGDYRDAVTKANAGPYRLAELDSIDRVRALIDANTAPGEQVLSFWPGYVFASHARQWPGFENDIASLTAAEGHYSDEKARRYHLITTDELERVIRERRPRVIVHGPLGQASERNWQAIIRESGYFPIETKTYVSVFLRAGEGAHLP